MMARASLPTSLIPVLVTGILPAQVLGLEGLSRRADARRLDFCDKHRNEASEEKHLTTNGHGQIPRHASRRST